MTNEEMDAIAAATILEFSQVRKRIACLWSGPLGPDRRIEVTVRGARQCQDHRTG